MHPTLKTPSSPKCASLRSAKRSTYGCWGARECGSESVSLTVQALRALVDPFKLVSLDPTSRTNALLLTTNTEVSIAPKLRAGSSTKQATVSASSITSASAIPQSQPSEFPSKFLRVLPSSALSSTLSLKSINVDGYTRPEPLAYVARTTFFQLTGSGSESSTDFGAEFYLMTVKRLRPPADPTDMTPPSTSPQPVAPRILTAGGSRDAAANTDGGKQQREVLVSWANGIPESHVVFLVGGIEAITNWDIIR